MTLLLPRWKRIATSTLRQLRDEIRFSGRLAEAAPPNRWVSCAFPIEGTYVVSTEKGIFLLRKNEYRQVSQQPTFGISLAGAEIYSASWQQHRTFILKGRRDALRSGGSFDWQEIFSIPTQSDAGRIHQISALGDSLWLANTAQNLYTKIDRHSGTWRASLAPFHCSFGYPITSDHNHVNSINAQPNYLVFGAFSAGNHSAFGLVGAGKIRLYSYPNMGIHDCILAGDDFWFSDSYRMWGKSGSGGIPVLNGQPFASAYFDKYPALFVRGIAGQGSETIIGNSFTGERDRRFGGSGTILRAVNGAVADALTFPASQIYDIVRLDGEHFDRVPGPKTYDQACVVLDRVLGPPLSERPLRDCLLGPNPKKRPITDIGQVLEYLSPADHAKEPIHA